MTPPTKPPSISDSIPRVDRGGGWNFTGPSMFRSANRFRFTPANRIYYLGFRCAQRGCRMPLKGGVGQ